ncbi:hypothetical protein LTR82_015355 [Friedmanniomyces endolithicus]|uniref:Uncharacterized protein n=1 Tax=Friedmanniomyces endolithicus TaxID=329885 RepID=A0AAN6F8C9_9PEZI|nr:hypothetical protein LTR82_015355 [Friedmanniomyces endolithicus]
MSQRPNISSRDRRLLELQAAIDAEPEKLETTFLNISRRSYQPPKASGDGVVKLATKPVSYAYHTKSALATSPPLCTNKCNICSSQYRSLELQREFEGQCYDRVCTDNEARDMIAQYISSTERNLAETRELLLKYGDILARRWLKYDPTRRKTVLRTAMPDMFAMEWLGAYYLFDEEGDKLATGDRANLHYKWRKGWLLPYVNVEVMSRDAQKLLVLLFLRTNRDPNDFLAYDIERTKTAFRDHHVKICYNHHCVVVCNEAGQVGALTSWSRDGVHRGDIVGFPRAGLGFEAARDLSVFLRNITKTILENVPPEARHGCLELDGHAEKYMAAASVNGGLAYIDRPFSKPESFDLSRLRHLLQSLPGPAVDKLKFMQTDMLFFREKLAEIRSSRHHRKLSEEAQAKDLLRSVIYVVGHVEVAAIVVNTSFALLETMRQNARNVTRGQPLPEVYDLALGCVEQLLSGYYRIYREGLPALLDHCDDLKHKTKHTKQTPCESFRGDPLVWNLTRLCTRAIDVSQVQSFHLGYIDALLASSEEQKERIDKVLREHLSEMLVIDEALTMVTDHLPPSRKLYEIPGVMEWLVPAYMIDLGESRYQELLMRFTKLVAAKSPSEETTKDNFTKLQTTQTLASKFWREMRRVWSNCMPISIIITSHLSEFDSTTHLTKVQNECDQYKAELLWREEASKARSSKPRQPAPAPVATQTTFDAGPSTPSTPLAPIPRKDKIKTRPEEETAALAQAAAQVQLADEAAAVEDAPPPNPTIAVCRESIVIFGRMYGRDAANRGLTKWLDLVAALVDAGLSPVHSGGSAVTFAHSDPTKGAITMHAPHPGITVRLTTLRSEGRRLQERFKWDESTFVLQG